MKNSRISIKVDQEYRTSIEEKASQAGLTISAYIRYCLDNVRPKSDQVRPESEQVRPESDQDRTAILHEHINVKDQQIEKLQQALDQQQQLHAVSQNTVEAQRLQLEEAKRPQPLLARLKAVFAPE